MSEFHKKHRALMQRLQSPKEDKENVSSKGVSINGDPPVIKAVKLDENIRKQYEVKGAIPKRFAGSKSDINNENSSNFKTRKTHDSCLPQKNIIYPSKLSKFVGKGFLQTKFQVFHQDNTDIKSGELQYIKFESDVSKVSSTFLENERKNNESIFACENEKVAAKTAFKRAKDFFSVHEGKAVDIKPKHPQLQKVRDIEGQNGKFDNLTPHDGLPPQPKKVKLSYREAAHGNKDNKIVTASVLSPRDRLGAEDFEEFMNSVEKKDKRRSFFPNYRDQNASTHNRQAVVSFIIRRGYQNYLSSYLIYQAVRIFDDVLQSQLIPQENLQLFMITALWIAMKKDYFAPRMPGAQRMTGFSPGLYTEKDLVSCETNILTSLSFDFSYPDVMSIFSYFIISLEYANLISDAQYQMIYYSGGYMIDLALLDEDLMKTPVLLLAAAAAELSAIIVMEQEETINTAILSKRWRAQAASRRFNEQQIKRIRTIIIRDIIESKSPTSTLHIVYKKYVRSRYGRVSSKLVAKIEKIHCQ